MSTVESPPERRLATRDPEPEGGAARSVADRFAGLWERSRWPGIAAGVAAAAAWGVLAGRWTPRGPLTSRQALWSIVISLAVGGLAGFASRSRWAMLYGPIAFVAAVEVVRLGTSGPTVDRPAFSTYGLLALAVGRGFHGLVSWAPMLLGAAFGAGAARTVEAASAARSSGAATTDHAPREGSGPAGPHTGGPARPGREPGRRWARVGRRVVAGLATAGLVALAVMLARPARTEPIVDADGRPVEGSIAELTRIEVNGRDHGLMIRGYSARNPVLLFLAGGPGGSELGAMRRHLPDLERHFTVVTWDQRGTGRSYPALDPTGTVTLDGAIDDALAVTDYLRDRFDQDRVILVGQSWGSLLGVLAADAHPEKYRAFVGVGQMVSPRETDRIFYRDTLAWARRRGDGELARKLTSIGPPPYTRMLDYETALSYEHEVYPYDHRPNHEGEGGFSENFLVEEYSLVDQVHLLGAFMDTFSALYPKVQGVDLRTQVTRLEVPVFFAQGAHEARGRAEPFEEWYEILDAPVKERATFATSGHRPLFEQPDEFVAFMVGTVLPAAGSRG